METSTLYQQLVGLHVNRSHVTPDIVFLIPTVTHDMRTGTLYLTGNPGKPLDEYMREQYLAIHDPVLSNGASKASHGLFVGRDIGLLLCGRYESLVPEGLHAACVDAGDIILGEREALADHRNALAEDLLPDTGNALHRRDDTVHSVIPRTGYNQHGSWAELALQFTGAYHALTRIPVVMPWDERNPVAQRSHDGTVMYLAARQHDTGAYPHLLDSGLFYSMHNTFSPDRGVRQAAVQRLAADVDALVARLVRAAASR
ncbi:hypothetical protein COY28_03665 [Candidatus Woesearchaeota archaeon CG_4_10_14_0_2_um_filter_57_5]|nr:MAG: hypothetical protein AUJ68_05305 [Candidatus Woesearchaeota archaeon CG1_02_57_44]PIN68188.1 MAG: hypothetical protein COV94_05975 [Candidatus Woesearchaeota archaeon CG11_big_fil_rev_8_21_14_0_20_57_5]PIZ53325.1 MAG: hypothetical protein COY28_03665 [Candidatus Woesearchaeota archaeon CG_4_10_14_0_2_um_filter_57_5]